MEKEFGTLSAKLNIIKSSIVEIENFTHKQSELFEVLSRRFPNIEQFTNAFKEAHELRESTKRLEAETNLCAQFVTALSTKINAEKNLLKEKKETERLLIEIISKIDNMDEKTVNNLKKLISSAK
ncbi:MAG: hypothetical protein LBS26_03335 [Campylobacteraceae bacterium]|jgi:uncharacterized phage infection (PIP) family protein YhgE|nr:hypothetical protein [Campylobacteraceae bacterium]